MANLVGFTAVDWVVAFTKDSGFLHQVAQGSTHDTPASGINIFHFNQLDRLCSFNRVGPLDRSVSWVLHQSTRDGCVGIYISSRANQTTAVGCRLHCSNGRDVSCNITG